MDAPSDLETQSAETDEQHDAAVGWRGRGSDGLGPLSEVWAAVLGGGWLAALAVFFTTTPAPPEGEPLPPFELLDVVGFAMLATLLATTALAARRSAHTPALALITGGLAIFGQLACATLGHAPVTASWFVLQTATMTVMAGVSAWAYLNRDEVLS